MHESRETPWLVSLGWGHSLAPLQQTTLWFGYTRQVDFQEVEGAEERPCVTEHPWPMLATTSTAGPLAPGREPACPPAQGWGLSSPPSLSPGERQKAKCPPRYLGRAG